MRYCVVFITCLIILSCTIATTQQPTQPPPFSTITITGTMQDVFNRVSLFERGGESTPIKTAYISSSDRRYSIKINIPGDMKQAGNYFSTDMRFWSDNNNNGVRDSREPISQCHFIKWDISSNKIYMDVFMGSKYEIQSPTFRYDYKK